LFTATLLQDIERPLLQEELVISIASGLETTVFYTQKFRSYLNVANLPADGMFTT